MREITGSTRYVKYSECKPGQTLVHGTYVGPQEGTYGTEYVFNEGFDTVVLGARGHLSWALSKCKPGMKLMVNYVGKEVMQDGKFKGKDVHKFKVFDDSPPAQAQDAAESNSPLGDDEVPF